MEFFDIFERGWEEVMIMFLFCFCNWLGLCFKFGMVWFWFVVVVIVGIVEGCGIGVWVGVIVGIKVEVVIDIVVVGRGWGEDMVLGFICFIKILIYWFFFILFFVYKMCWCEVFFLFVLMIRKVWWRCCLFDELIGWFWWLIWVLVMIMEFR